MFAGIKQLFTRLGSLSSVVIFALPWNRLSSNRNVVWVLLQEDFPDEPIIGVFSDYKEAEAYADEFLAKHPTRTVEFCSHVLNEKIFMRGAKPYR